MWCSLLSCETLSITPRTLQWIPVPIPPHGRMCFSYEFPQSFQIWILVPSLSMPSWRAWLHEPHVASHCHAMRWEGSIVLYSIWLACFFFFFWTPELPSSELKVPKLFVLNRSQYIPGFLGNKENCHWYHLSSRLLEMWGSGVTCRGEHYLCVAICLLACLLWFLSHHSKWAS